MATAASNPHSSSKSAPVPHPPQNWWQWVLVYPALAISLMSAAPAWVDKAKAYSLGVRSAAEAERQAALWQKNASCVGLNSSGFLSPRRIAVDATICNSGDILVRAITPQKKEIFKWLPLDDVVRTARSGGLISAAHAATGLPGLPSSAQSPAAPAVKLALLQANVICTRSDGRFLLRRIQTPNGCFDEVIDTFTGALVSRNQAPCIPQC